MEIDGGSQGGGGEKLLVYSETIGVGSLQVTTFVSFLFL